VSGRYVVKEVFYSLQGEGVRAGTPNVFVRFAGCNLNCRIETRGFDCDTDFVGGEQLSAQELHDLMASLWPRDHASERWVVMTGGEPCLQLDQPLVDFLHVAGWKIAIETNGTICPPCRLDWITVSPKGDGKPALMDCDEVKYVLCKGKEPPAVPALNAKHWLVSPAFAL